MMKKMAMTALAIDGLIHGCLCLCWLWLQYSVIKRETHSSLGLIL
jgi:hypothetical protein